MKKIEIYTFEDAKKEMEEGKTESEVAVKKWESIVQALRAVEEVSIQITSFCLNYQKFNCKGCPITKYDYPCGHPYASFTIFYHELKKLRALAESLYAILIAIDREDKESKSKYI
ncbi:MAG: hypothetical protein J7K36_07915 [Archaeoglobaceae archaeon]|nr:hypothetical protein [Archaeoglobaceae archaeon]